ncbi:MAG: hypothetical protein RL708_970 [Bacteroidota bacterium]|jgi:hypothetical protein
MISIKSKLVELIIVLLFLSLIFGVLIYYNKIEKNINDKIEFMQQVN